jgi:hypothetical protein
MPTASDNKRAALKNRMNLLIEAGAYLNGDSGDSMGGGYEGGSVSSTPFWHDRFFRGSLYKAKEQSVNTVALGIELAKELMTSRDSVRSLTFQTLVETAIGASHLSRNWFSSNQGTNIQQTGRELSKNYGLLKPQGNILSGNFSWLDQLWDMAETPSSNAGTIRIMLFNNSRYPESQSAGIVGTAVRSFMNLKDYDAEASDLKMLQMSDRLLKSAITIGGWRSDLETVEFTHSLLNFGYEVLKVNPTVDATNGTEVSNWIETLLEGGDVKLAAAGMSDFLSGVTTRGDRIKTLEYGDRLMDAAAGVQDVGLRSQVLKADTLSKIMNLGGAYLALKPNPMITDPNITNPKDFLYTIFKWSDIQTASGEMEEFFNNFKQPNLLPEVIPNPGR